MSGFKPGGNVRTKRGLRFSGSTRHFGSGVSYCPGHRFPDFLKDRVLTHGSVQKSKPVLSRNGGKNRAVPKLKTKDFQTS
jgi:hypothetical protein